MAREMREKATVVTSDREVQTAAELYHATAVSSEDFEQRMDMAFHMSQKGTEVEHTDEKERATGTRKKGPAKRLPKSVRKAQRRMRRL